MLIQLTNLSSLEEDKDLASLEEEDEEFQQAQTGKGIVYYFKHLNRERWLQDLQQDSSQLLRLYKNAQ
ncbi:MAG: hypothetical protein QXZ70_04090 [Candidatus Bathyarchaeia archaeon]